MAHQVPVSTNRNRVLPQDAGKLHLTLPATNQSLNTKDLFDDKNRSESRENKINNFSSEWSSSARNRRPSLHLRHQETVFLEIGFRKQKAVNWWLVEDCSASNHLNTAPLKHVVIKVQSDVNLEREMRKFKLASNESCLHTKMHKLSPVGKPKPIFEWMKCRSRVVISGVLWALGTHWPFAWCRFIRIGFSYLPTVESKHNQRVSSFYISSIVNFIHTLSILLCQYIAQSHLSDSFNCEGSTLSFCLWTTRQY